MKSCPTLDELFANRNLIASRAHVRDCDSCRDLADLATVPLPNGAIDAGDEACADAELLLAVFAERDLEPDDSDALTDHLADCSRCTIAAQSLLLATTPAPRPEPKAWATPVAPRTPPMNMLKSPWFYVASSVAIGLPVLVVLMAMNSDADQSASDSSPPPAPRLTMEAKEGPSPAAGRVEKSPEIGPEKKNPEKESPEKKNPEKESPEKKSPEKKSPEKKDAPADVDHTTGDRLSEAQQKLLEVALKDAIIAGDFREAYRLCDRLAPSGRQAVAKKCVLTACRDGNVARAKRALKRVKSAASRQQLASLCTATYGIELD